MSNNLKKLAIELIRYSIKLKNFPKQKEDIKEIELRKKYINIIDRFKHCLDVFKTQRKFASWKEQEISAEQLMRKLNENLSEKMSELISFSQEQIESLEFYLNCTKEIHSEIKNNSGKLEIMTKGLYEKVI